MLLFIGIAIRVLIFILCLGLLWGFGFLIYCLDSIVLFINFLDKVLIDSGQDINQQSKISNITPIVVHYNFQSLQLQQQVFLYKKFLSSLISALCISRSILVFQ